MPNLYLLLVHFSVSVLEQKVYRYNPTEICQQTLQGVRNETQKLCFERSFKKYRFHSIVTMQS